MVVTDVVTFYSSAYSQTDLLFYAGCAEQASEHPIAKSIVQMASKSTNLVDPENFAAIPGKGIICSVKGSSVVVGNHSLMNEQKLSGSLTAAQSSEISNLENDGKTIVIVAVDRKIIGCIGLTDPIRPEALETVKYLHLLGIRDLLIVSGDNPRSGKNKGMQRSTSTNHSLLYEESSCNCKTTWDYNLYWFCVTK